MALVHTYHVYQDGVDFYQEGVGNEETGSHLVSAPFAIIDGDIIGATKARVWFYKWCDANSIHPIFE